MIDDLLNLARLDRRSMTLQMTSLNSLVENVLHDLESETADRKIDWRVGSLPSVSCDDRYVAQQHVIGFSLKHHQTRDFHTQCEHPDLARTNQFTVVIGHWSWVLTNSRDVVPVSRGDNALNLLCVGFRRSTYLRFHTSTPAVESPSISAPSQLPHIVSARIPGTRHIGSPVPVCKAFLSRWVRQAEKRAYDIAGVESSGLAADDEAHMSAICLI